MIERQIITGLIVSSDYLRSIRNIWDVSLIESNLAKRISLWCWEYFEKYNKAPGKDIQNIYYTKLKETKIPDDLAKDIEDVLSGLSDENESTNFNLTYLVDETRKYFTNRRLEQHIATIKGHLSADKLDSAEQTACNYKPLRGGDKNDLDISDEETLNRIENAFITTKNHVVSYPGILGTFWNDQMVRGGLVAFLAPEKRGKTYLMIDMAIRTCKQGNKVAFFQAGDLTEGSFLKRICIYLAQKSDREKYCTEHYQPVADCVKNQVNDCKLDDRTCHTGVFEDRNEKEVRNELQLDNIIEAFENNQKYKPCTNCDLYKDPKRRLGTTWLKRICKTEPLTMKEAKKLVNDFFVIRKRVFRLSTHANNTLSVSQIRTHLDIWEKEDGFIPDLIIIDYADLLVAETNKEYRHQQNEIWKGLRRLSQEKGQPLVVTATQSDADSYDKDRLRLSNFSEDKRKYGHVTAFYGLNQDPKGREKRIGILRINELLLREDDFDTSREVNVLQNLRRGRPVLGSYW